MWFNTSKSCRFLTKRAYLVKVEGKQEYTSELGNLRNRLIITQIVVQRTVLVFGKSAVLVLHPSAPCACYIAQDLFPSRCMNESRNVS